MTWRLFVRFSPSENLPAVSHLMHRGYNTSRAAMSVRWRSPLACSLTLMAMCSSYHSAHWADVDGRQRPRSVRVPSALRPWWAGTPGLTIESMTRPQGGPAPRGDRL